MELEAWQAKGHDAGSIVADPKFVDPVNFDFALAPDSPVLEMGFLPIDSAKIGLIGQEEWVDLPRQLPPPPIEMPAGP